MKLVSLKIVAGYVSHVQNMRKFDVRKGGPETLHAFALEKNRKGYSVCPLTIEETPAAVQLCSCAVVQSPFILPL